MSLFKPSVKALNPLNRLNAIFILAVDRIAKSPYLFNWSMSSAICLYLMWLSPVQLLYRSGAPRGKPRRPNMEGKLHGPAPAAPWLPCGGTAGGGCLCTVEGAQRGAEWVRMKGGVWVTTLLTN